jgi:hypothetical protein
LKRFSACGQIVPSTSEFRRSDGPLDCHPRGAGSAAIRFVPPFIQPRSHKKELQSREVWPICGQPLATFRRIGSREGWLGEHGDQIKLENNNFKTWEGSIP